MNEFRKSIVLKAFKKLDANKNGVVQAVRQEFYILI